MSEVGAYPHSPAPELPLASRVLLCDDLQLVLVNLVDLTLLGKQLQWVVSGARAAAVAAELHSIVGAWRESADAVAGQMRRLGRVPNGQSRTVAVEGELEPLPTRWIPAVDGLLALAIRIDHAARRVALAERDAALEDSATERVLGEVRAKLRRTREVIAEMASEGGASGGSDREVGASS